MATSFDGHNDSTGTKDAAHNYTIKDTTTGAVQLGALVKDPAVDAPAGFTTVVVNGTSYQVPFYASA